MLKEGKTKSKNAYIYAKCLERQFLKKMVKWSKG